MIKQINSALMMLVLISSNLVYAFDDEREGFIVGLGVGYHSSGSDGSEGRESGLATSFKLGYGFTNQISVYYVREASWYKEESFSGAATIVLGIAGLGATYYLESSSPSVYFSGGIGAGNISAPFEEDNFSQSGSALLFGAGYEISDHVQVGLNYLSLDINSVGMSSVQLMVNYLWY